MNKKLKLININDIYNEKLKSIIKIFSIIKFILTIPTIIFVVRLPITWFAFTFVSLYEGIFLISLIAFFFFLAKLIFCSINIIYIFTDKKYYLPVDIVSTIFVIIYTMIFSIILKDRIEFVFTIFIIAILLLNLIYLIVIIKNRNYLK